MTRPGLTAGALVYSSSSFGLWSEVLPGDVGIRKALMRCQQNARLPSVGGGLGGHPLLLVQDFKTVTVTTSAARVCVFILQYL